MKTIIAMHQHQGDREYQQDTMCMKSLGSAGTLCVLADGMGGYEGGEIASQLIRDSFMKLSIDSDDIGNILEKNIHLSNKAIAAYKETHPEVKSMGSTAVALFATNTTFQWVSVGDSPLYVMRNNKNISRVNENHSIAGILELQFKNGEITQKDIDANPNKHMLTSALTGEKIEAIDVSKEYPIKENYLFILASDGIETLSEKEISNIISKYDVGTQAGLNDASKALVDAVIAAAKPNQDNVTVILLGQEGDVSSRHETLTDIIPKKKDKLINITEAFGVKSRKLLYMSGVIVIFLGILLWQIIGVLGEDDSINIMDANDTNNTERSKNLNNVEVLDSDVNKSILKESTEANSSKIMPTVGIKVPKNNAMTKSTMPVKEANVKKKIQKPKTKAVPQPENGVITTIDIIDLPANDGKAY